jgi:hypothetical protein
MFPGQFEETRWFRENLAVDQEICSGRSLSTSEAREQSGQPGLANVNSMP